MKGAGLSDRKGYLAIAAISLIAITVFITLLLRGVISNRENFVHCDAPGEATLSLTRPGDYTVFYEYEREDSSQAVFTPVGIENLRCTVAGANGDRVEVHRAPNFHSYALNRMRGQSLYDFTIPAAGEYRFASEYPPGVPPIPVHLVIRPYHRIQAVTLVAQCAAVLLIAAAAVALIVSRMRGSSPATVATPFATPAAQ